MAIILLMGIGAQSTHQLKPVMAVMLASGPYDITETLYTIAVSLEGILAHICLGAALIRECVAHQILEETLRASERQREHDMKQQEALLASAAAEHAAQERLERVEELDKVRLLSFISACFC